MAWSGTSNTDAYRIIWTLWFCIVYVPCGRFLEYERFRMIESLSPLIRSRQIESALALTA